jgi:membrane protease YdiL (CAAX protease family)
VLATNNLGMVATWHPPVWPLLVGPAHILLVLGTVAWARRTGALTWAELGLGRAGWRKGILPGIGLGLFMAALVGVLWLLARAIGWGSVTHVPQPTDPTAFGLKLLQLLLLTALYEELWFRGVLQACWVGLLGVGRGLLVGAVLFAAWHLALWAWTLDRVTLTPPLPFWLTYPGGLLILAVAGLLFGWLRHATGHLAGPVVAHWTIDVILVLLVIAGGL